MNVGSGTLPSELLDERHEAQQGLAEWSAEALELIREGIAVRPESTLVTVEVASEQPRDARKTDLTPHVEQSASAETLPTALEQQVGQVKRFMLQQDEVVSRMESSGLDDASKKQLADMLHARSKEREASARVDHARKLKPAAVRVDKRLEAMARLIPIARAAIFLGTGKNARYLKEHMGPEMKALSEHYWAFEAHDAAYQALFMFPVSTLDLSDKRVLHDLAELAQLEPRLPDDYMRRLRDLQRMRAQMEQTLASRSGGND